MGLSVPVVRPRLVRAVGRARSVVLLGLAGRRLRTAGRRRAGMAFPVERPGPVGRWCRVDGMRLVAPVDLVAPVAAASVQVVLLVQVVQVVLVGQVVRAVPVGPVGRM